METKTTILVLAILVAVTMLGTFSARSTNGQQTKGVTSITFERSAISGVDALIGHQGHQAVVVLPPRQDGKLWVGTVSWTASKPVELRLLYDYNSSLTTDAIHGRPATAPLAVTTEVPHIPIGEVAISLIKPPNGPPIASSFNSGSMSFVAKAVAFHTINGIPFTVTYAVDATAR